MFINDKLPKATTSGRLSTPDDWDLEMTTIENGVSIGSGAVIMCGITVESNSLIGAGAVVTADVPKNTTVAGVPARLTNRTSDR